MPGHGRTAGRSEQHEGIQAVFQLFKPFSNNEESACQARLRKALEKHGDHFRIDDNGAVSVDLNSRSFCRSLYAENADDLGEPMEESPKAVAE